jgi:hypothetical protein
MVGNPTSQVSKGGGQRGASGPGDEPEKGRRSALGALTALYTHGL